MTFRSVCISLDFVREMATRCAEGEWKMYFLKMIKTTNEKYDTLKYETKE